MPIPLLSEPDPYREAAARIFQVAEADVTLKQRRDAKAILKAQVWAATPETIAELVTKAGR